MTTATDTELDPWGLSSGLIDDFDGLITDAWFGTDAKYNDGGTVLLILELETDDPDRPLVTEMLSTGTGWEIQGGGASVTAESGKNRQFNKSSRVGGFVAALLEIEGMAAVLRSRGLPTEAATYKGLGLHWNRVTVKGFDGENKEVLLPTAYLPLAGTAPTAAAPAAASAPAESGVSAALMAKLKAAAKKADSHSDFIDAAFSIDGVTGNGDAEAIVVDEAQYVALKG